MATKDLKGNQKTVVQVFYDLLSGVILVVLKKCSSFGPVFMSFTNGARFVFTGEGRAGRY